MAAENGALSGLRVLDLSRVLAGPYCAQMLADHGADVLKIESPDGDDTRAWGPPYHAPGISSYYAGLNRNKRNRVLDLKSDAGKQELAELLEWADVVVENFKAGTLAGWGFDDEHIRETYPRLIHCRITGYGVDGPMGGVPGYDAVLQAYSGMMSINGEADREPLRFGAPVIDLVAAMLAFGGILLALNERHVSGQGQLVDTSLLDAGVSLLHPYSANWFASGELPVRRGSGHPNIVPYDTFRTRDGLFFLGVGNNRQFGQLMAVLGKPELVDTPEFATNSSRLANREQLTEILATEFAEWDRADLIAALMAEGVPCGPVNNIGEALTDPQVLHRQMVVDLDWYRGIGIPIKLSRTPGSIRTPPTALP